MFAPSVALDSASGNFIPPEERYYAGGPNDVRGYNVNELGPVVYVYPADSLTLGLQDSLARGLVQPRFSATGGNTVTIGQFEVRVPSPIWSSRVRLAAFVDAGSLWERGKGEPGTLYPADHAGLRRSYRDPAGARPSRCGVQPLRPADRAALS